MELHDGHMLHQVAPVDDGFCTATTRTNNNYKVGVDKLIMQLILKN